MNVRPDLRIGLGPVFAYDWIVSSRRWQLYAVRALFAAAMLTALVVIASNTGVPQTLVYLSELAKLGENFYIAVIGTQLTLVLLAAPAATAGAICRDRASGTITHLLVTDLSDFEIVFGKLAARLVPVVGLVACMLPLMAILTLMGGVDPQALFGAFMVTLGSALLGCSLALCFSLWARRTHEALLGTYAVWGLWLLGQPFVRMINGAFRWSLDIPSPLADPYFLAFAPYWHRTTVSWSDYVWFLVLATAISTVLALVAVFRLRAVCTRVNLAPKKSVRGRFEGICARLEPTQYLPHPSLDFNPVLWREWHRERPSRFGRIVVGVFVVGAFMASIAAIILPRGSFAMAWVNGFQVAIGMLLLSITAATSLAEERMRGSLDVLMATTLSTRQIVLGKWLGTFRRVPLLAILPVIVVICTDPRRRGYVATIVLTMLFVFCCGAAITGLGLLLATWCTRVGRAVALTVTLYVLVTVGWLFIPMWLHNGPEEQGMMMLSPFFFAGELAAERCGPGPRESSLDWATFWTICYALAGIVLLVTTLAIFNRCLGRVEYGLPLARRGMRPKPKRVSAPSTVSEVWDPA